MNEQDKIMVEELNKMVISSIPNNEWKVMVIKILTGLKERVDGLRDRLKIEREKPERAEEFNN